MILIDWLKNIREAADKSQAEVAAAASISQPSYSNIENGMRKPSVSTAKKIADFLGFSWTLFYEPPCSSDLVEAEPSDDHLAS